MIPALLFGIAAAQNPSGSLTVHLDRPLHPMAKGFYGLMTEEINHSYDGGLYGELVQNRALRDDPARLPHWSALDGGTLAVAPDGPPGTELGALRVEAGAAIANDGYWGIPVRPNTAYKASLWLQGIGSVEVAIETRDGSRTYAKGTVQGRGAWRHAELTLKTGAVPTTNDTRLVVRPGGKGTWRLAGLSLFGPTYRNRARGNRPDLTEMMRAMRPKFLRLPGGNYLEGDTIADRFDWKRTLGPWEKRPGHQGPWGYRSSDGMGLLEFLLWCDDLKIEPLLAVYAGYSLRGEHVEPGPALEPFVQDALDEIEFVTGDPKTTKWGALRAKLGHPKPFALRYVEIGNEDWFDRSGSYDGRFAQFHDAIKARYPQLLTIATAGVKLRTPDLMDDHYYRTAAEMANDAGHYDQADRKGPKVFVGEWATLEGDPTPNFQAALGDAAFLTGLERNSDHVVMEAYAPLLVNVNPGARQWNTNLIGYDGLRAFGSPSYWVQVMFGQNAGDMVLPVAVDPGKPKETLAYRGGVGVAGAGAEYRDVRVAGRTLPPLEGWSKRGGVWAAEGGVLRATGRNPVAYAGDPAWTDYTVTLKARRPESAGGFGVLFHFTDERNTFRWNVGGATNEIVHTEVFATRSVAKGEPAMIEPGRWADLRLEVAGGRIRGYVDGKLAIEATEPAPQIAPVYATAGQAGKDTILKVVNYSATPTPLRLDLTGTKAKRFALTGEVLSGPLHGVNTLDEPERYAPKPLPKSRIDAGGTYTFPAYSVTVLRLRAE